MAVPIRLPQRNAQVAVRGDAAMGEDGSVAVWSWFSAAAVVQL